MNLGIKIRLNYLIGYWTVRLFFLSLVGCLIGYSTVSFAWEEKSELAEIQPNAVFTMPGDPKVSSFRFSAGKVYLLSSGDVKIESWLKHKGLICGTYEIGVQFSCTFVSVMPQKLLLTLFSSKMALPTPQAWPTEISNFVDCPNKDKLRA